MKKSLNDKFKGKQVKAFEVLDINSPQYWDTVYKAETESGYGRVYEKLYEVVALYIKPDAYLLDFGCGPGFFLEWLRKRYPYMRLRGVDFSRFAIKTARQRLLNAEFVVDSKICGGPYDVITALHVLEHFHNPHFYIEQAFKALKDDGTLILVFPTYDQPWLEHYRIWTLDFLRLFMKQQLKWKWTLIHRPHTGHYHKNGEPIEETIVLCKKAVEKPKQ